MGTKFKTKLKLVKPSTEFTTLKYFPDFFEKALLLIEECGRVSHKSEGRITEGSADPFVRKIGINFGHETILEHMSFTVCFKMSRAASHQLVRHRIAAYTQESQRYCDYSKGGDPMLQIIVPNLIREQMGEWWKDQDNIVAEKNYSEEETIVLNKGAPNKILYRDAHRNLFNYLESVANDYEEYLNLVKDKVKAEDARYLLPNASKTEVYTTFNLRQWRHFFKMRLDSHAQWEIKEVANDVFNLFKENCPLLVENLYAHNGEKLE